MKKDVEFINKVKEYIISQGKYCRAEDILEGLNIKNQRVYLSYRGVDITIINKECGFIRRERTTFLKYPAYSKDVYIEKIKKVIISQNRYLTPRELHTKFKIHDIYIGQYNINVHEINLSLSYYKDSPQSRINKRDLELKIRNYIQIKNRYVSQQEIVEEFNISLAFLTQSELDTVRLNTELGFGNNFHYFEIKVMNMLYEFYDCIIREKTFNKCRSDLGYLLRYDFYIEEDRLLVEADGSQHWDNTHRFYNEQVPVRDKKKSDYAIENKYLLVKIPILKSRKGNTLEYIRSIFLENLKNLITTTQLEIANVKVRKALGLDNQQPSL